MVSVMLSFLYFVLKVLTQLLVFPAKNSWLFVGRKNLSFISSPLFPVTLALTLPIVLSTLRVWAERFLIYDY